MNIFYLHHNPEVCARLHVDKHVVKMILEYSQLLSTTHRVLDGVEYTDTSSGRAIKRWKLQGDIEQELYKATHVNHPSAVWVRQSEANYHWLVNLLSELCKEYTYRYGKVHKCEYSGLVDLLYINSPRGIPNKPFTEPTPAMPDEYIVKGDSLTSYRQYYKNAKQDLFSWKGREVPEWVGG
jgi:hypothetical protein